MESTTPAPTTVRLHLVRFVLGFMLPTVLATAGAVFYVYQEERKGFEASLIEATRALSLVVEGELMRREAILRTLAESPTLTRGDLAAFYGYAKQIAPGSDATIVLVDLDGNQVLNTRRPLGEKLPPSVFGPLRHAADPLATRLSDVYMAPIGRNHSFAIQVPVVREGQVIYYLSMGSFVGHLQKVLEKHGLPPGWIGTVLDRRGSFVARTHNPEKFVGQAPPPKLLEVAERSQGQVFNVPAAEGHAVVASFSRSPVYGWGFFIGVPESQITSPARIAASVAAFAAVLLALALWAAIALGRRLAAPIRRLSESASALGRGEQVSYQPTGLAEADPVARALADASHAIRASNEQLELRVQQALDEAERAHRAVIRSQRLEAVGQLTGGVAHDFNNLLMVVATNVYLLQKLRPELRDDAQLARIDKAVSTGTKLTRQLLAFARRQPVRPQVIDVAQLLPELVELLRPTMGGTISVSCEVEPGIPCIEVDPAEFELAIINLAVNARDAMGAGGRLVIRAGHGTPGLLPDTAGVVIVEVSDTGTGIDPALLDKVFEPFFTTKEVGHGTGLGLSQVYGMAAQAGGKAQIQSRPGDGTTVRIVLPASARAATRDDSREQQEDLRLDRTILLVEDNADLAQVTRELLAGSGCLVHYATTGADALRMLPSLQPSPDAVLSDIRMPGEIDGVALAAYLRKSNPRLPVVLMTGYTSELEAARAMDLLVLAKPVQPGELLAAIESAARGHALPASRA